MTEPIKSNGSEDVLSSAKRLLVSERPNQAPDEQSVPPSNRLVLTPALRVAGLSGEDAEPEEAEISAADLLAKISAGIEEARDNDSDVSDLLDRVAQQADLAESLQDEIATTGHDEDVAAFETSPEPETAPLEDFIFEDIAQPDVEILPQDDGPSEESYASPQNLAEKIATLEEVIARSNEASELDEPVLEETVKVETPQAATDPSAEIYVDAQPDPSEQLSIDDGDILDEAALRELVAELVREELQGGLGERITRNVRKLVRREIHRALAAQDLR